MPLTGAQLVDEVNTTAPPHKLFAGAGSTIQILKAVAVPLLWYTLIK